MSEYIDLSDVAASLLAARLTNLIDAATLIVRDEVVTFMDPGPPRTGRKYRVPGTSARYTASAPGEPPAIREGRYRESWKTSPAVVQGNRVIGSAFTDLKVGEGGEHVLGDLLEHGTIRMAPRPHVRPAVEAARAKIRQLIQRPA